MLEFEKPIKNLEDKKVVVYRNFKNAYALYSGSDINLDEVTELNKTPRGAGGFGSTGFN